MIAKGVISVKTRVGRFVCGLAGQQNSDFRDLLPQVHAGFHVGPVIRQWQSNFKGSLMNCMILPTIGTARLKVNTN
jgi:hypothetical protein